MAVTSLVYMAWPNILTGVMWIPHPCRIDSHNSGAKNEVSPCTKPTHTWSRIGIYFYPPSLITKKNREQTCKIPVFIPHTCIHKPAHHRIPTITPVGHLETELMLRDTKALTEATHSSEMRLRWKKQAALAFSTGPWKIADWSFCFEKDLNVI